MLDQLLGPAMQETNMRVDALDHLTVELEHEPQHAVGRRVLGPEIEGEIAQSGFGHSGLASAAGSTPAAPWGFTKVPRRLAHVTVASPPSKLAFPRLSLSTKVPSDQARLVMRSVRQVWTVENPITWISF